MLQFYLGHAMLVDKFHGTFSFRQIKWLENYKIFKTRKRNFARMNFLEAFLRTTQKFLPWKDDGNC